MSRDPITAQRGRELVPLLKVHGWRVLERTYESLDWWADERWTLESVWSPQGALAYLTFLVDLQDEQRVWALAATGHIPADRLDTNPGRVIALRKEWNKALPSFLAALDDLRGRSNGGETGV